MFILIDTVCLGVFVFIVGRLIYEFIYEWYLSKSPISSVAFWQDNRTYCTRRTLPSAIITVDKVNLSNFTLVITACCRNVEKHLPGFQKNVRAIGALFRFYRLYLGESDSDDGTFKFIQKWMEDDPDHVKVYSVGQQRWYHPFRK